MPSEISVNRENTIRFIQQNPTDIVLLTRRRQKDGFGTRWVEGSTRESQTFRLIDQSGSSRPVPGLLPASLPGGQQRKIEYMLLGKHDAVVEVGDYWVDESDIRWEIEELLPDNGYEVRATVIRYGEG